MTRPVDYSRDWDQDNMQEILDLGEARGIAKAMVKENIGSDRGLELLQALSENEQDAVILELEDKGYHIDMSAKEFFKPL